MVYVPNIYVSTPILLHNQCPILNDFEVNIITGCIIHLLFCLAVFTDLNYRLEL
jgi:hypothetical protein